MEGGRAGGMFPVANGATNDLGEYRIAGLAKGQYVVSVNAPRFQEGRKVIRAGGEQAYLTMFYPGTADREQARCLEVTEGAQLHDLEVQLKKARSFHVRGRVNATDNTAADGRMFVSLRPKSPAGGGHSFIDGGMNPTEDGTFDIAGVLPGTYIVTAVMNTSGGKSRNAHAEVEVKDQNVEGLVVSFVNGIAIEGEIHTLQPPVGFKPGSVSVFLTAEDGGFGSPQIERGAGGKFTLQDVQPGQYRVSSHIEGEAGYVKSVSYNGNKVTAPELEISAGDAGGKIDVTVAFDTAEIAGVVQDASGAAKPGAMVLFLRDGQALCSCSRSAIADQQGHYQVKGLAPGDYLATARVEDDEGNFAAGDSKEELRKTAAKVTVAPRAKQSFTVQIPK
jgi:protocatechuate 3,4-dioxygenase beta subunit